MTTTLDLPSAIEPPPGHKPSRAQRARRRRVARREFLSLSAAAALGTGLAFASMMPTARRAYATHLTPSTTSAGCYGPTRTNQSLSGNTGCCTCGSVVSSSNCNSEGWHRHHTQSGGGGCGCTPTWTRYYQPRDKSCLGRRADGTLVTEGKNSWLWTIAGTSETWRCSDGEYKVCTDGNCGDWIESVCPKMQ